MKPEEHTLMKMKVEQGIKIEDVRPCQDLLIIEVLPAETVTKAGLIIPEIARERPLIGVVLAAGPGKMRADGSLIPMDCKVGDWVTFSPYANMEMLFDPIQGINYKIVHDDHIVGIIEKDEENDNETGIKN